MLRGGLREGSERKSVQDLEPNVLGKLLSTCGARGGDTEAAWRGHQDFRGADRGGPGRPDGGGAQAGGEGRTDLPSGLVRLPAGAVRTARGRQVPTTMLEK